jgi:hypothetical protein
MGFFKKLASGNFGLMARNITSYYMTLKNVYPSLFSDEKKYLLFAGILDAKEYYFRGQIPFRTIKDIVYEDSYLRDDGIFHLAFYLEIEMFSVDTKMNLWEIRKIVESQMNTIQENVEIVRNEYLSGKTSRKKYSMIIESVLSSNVGKDIINQINN